VKNPCLAAALGALEECGIRDVEQVHGGKHLQLRWRVNGHDMHIYSMPCTPSDFRSPRNVRADIRRLLREDGVLVTPERPASPPARKPDRVTVLEQRIAALERAMAELRSQIEGMPSHQHAMTKALENINEKPHAA
jgi:hypothetical protein